MQHSSKPEELGIVAGLSLQIMEAIHQPRQLEALYRIDKKAFASAFNSIYPQIKDSATADFWFERLNYKADTRSAISSRELGLVAIAILIAGLILKIPDIFSLDEEFFYSRNLSFAFFPLLMVYFLWKRGAGIKELMFISAGVLLSVVFINLLPKSTTSNTLMLACMHLPLFLWGLLGVAFMGDQYREPAQRIHYLRFNGDLVVMSVLLAISGGIFSAITLGLFSLIGIPIQDFFTNYMIRWGAPAIPIISAALVTNYPQMVDRISPIIAKIFTPLVGIMLFAFLVAMIIQGKDPYQDREFLLLFNVMLIGVMAIILFSVGEASKSPSGRLQITTLFILSLLAVMNNGIALSAIAYRLMEFGLTPNRIAVLGSNMCIMAHLVWVSISLYGTIRLKRTLSDVENVIGSYLPVYILWTAAVIFLLPFLFQFA